MLSVACLVLESCPSDRLERADSSKYPEATTPTTCASENGDDNDEILSLSDCSSMSERTLCSWDVTSIVKSTFIEFKPIDGDARPVLRRVKSAPSLSNVESCVVKCIEAGSPTISASVSSDSGSDSASMQLSSQNRVTNWADCDDCDLDAHDLDDLGETLPTHAHQKSKRRSGRARQRESRRRRMRTPSPEMRSPYF